jgi:hypothetical protein
MQLYRRGPKRDWKKWAEKVTETGIKLAVLCVLPLPAAGLACVIWYFVFYQKEWGFHDGLDDVVALSWISIHGILYSLLATVIIGIVFGEYKEIRMAIKRHDKAEFMNLRDEDVSPIIHAFMTLLAANVLFTFVGLPYPSVISGCSVMGTMTYVFAFIYWVIREVDNPFSGIWFIKHIPEGWLDEDPRQWRDSYYAKVTQDTVTTTDEGTKETTVTTTVEERTEVPAAAE